jgi:tetratricopeptide (TPR) repeat protein
VDSIVPSEAMNPFSNSSSGKKSLDVMTTIEAASRSVSASGMATSRLPPKSPSSTTGKFLLTTTSRSAIPKRKKRRGKSKERRRNSQAKAPSLTGIEQVDQSLSDPWPDHLNVVDADDLSSVDDFSMVSFEKSNSPTSVLDPLRNIDQNTKRRHRKAKSWDSSDTYEDFKTCLQVPSIFRRQKVMCADVASVGNASDTVVSVAETGRITGRELHETAKSVLNSGDYESAVTMFESLQKAQTERFGEEHSSVGAATHNVGVVRLRMGQHKSAEEILVRAVAIRRKVLGNDHLDLAVSTSNAVGSCLFSDQRPDHVLPLFLGLQASLTKLGSARVALLKFDDGLQDLREALQISRKTLGRGHKTVAQILCHIACLYFEAGELFSAQATFEDALDIYRDVFPTDTGRDACMAQMTETLCNIGSIQNKRKNFSGAIESFREALDLQRGIMGHDNPRVIASLDNLGYSFSKNKSYHQALTCYKEMLSAQISHYGAFTMDCCETLKKQILINEKLKDLDGAIKKTKKALVKIRQNLESPVDPVILEIEQMISELKRKRDKRKGEF